MNRPHSLPPGFGLPLLLGLLILAGLARTAWSAPQEGGVQTVAKVLSGAVSVRRPGDGERPTVIGDEYASNGARIGESGQIEEFTHDARASLEQFTQSFLADGDTDETRTTVTSGRRGPGAASAGVSTGGGGGGSTASQ